MRHQDGTVDSVEVAKFEARMFALLADQAAEGPQTPDPKAAAARDREPARRSRRRTAGPGRRPTNPPTTVCMLTFEEGEPPDAGRSPTPDETHDAVDAAERAVFELKARRALEEQYAQDRDGADAELDRAFYRAAFEADAWGSIGSTDGPTLSAVGDE